MNSNDPPLKIFSFQLNKTFKKHKHNSSLQTKMKFLAATSHRRRQTTQIQNQSTDKLILPTFNHNKLFDKRRSFIDIYQQNIIQKSLSKKSRQQMLQKSKQFQKQSILMRKKLLKKAWFRVQGLPSIIQQKQLHKDITIPTSTGRNTSKNALHSSRLSSQFQLTQRPRRHYTQQKFQIQPWQK